jgi:hypothetical protein
MSHPATGRFAMLTRIKKWFLEIPPPPIEILFLLWGLGIGLEIGFFYAIS